jgi:protein ImuB
VPFLGFVMKQGQVSDKRIMSIWLVDWPVHRLARAHGVDAAEPLALRASRQGGERVFGLNEPARALGVSRGQLLADALAVARGLKVHAADSHEDAKVLKQVSDWCGRYTPWTAPDPVAMYEEPDGILLDITGCAHLFGGEVRMAQDIVRRLSGFGFPACVGIAPCPGAAWAMARYSAQQISFVARDTICECLDPLPLAALRLDLSMVDDLARLGVKRVGNLRKLARAPLVARFGKVLATRLDQALNRAAEPISPDLPLVAFRTRRHFVEGLITLPDIEQAIQFLCEDMVPLLKQAHEGARRLHLHLFRTDGVRNDIQVGASVPSNDGAHLAALFRERFTGFGRDLEMGLEMGLGIDAMVLNVTASDPIVSTQAEMAEEKKTRLKKRPNDLGLLVDRLGNRLGFERVGRFEPRESHVPERAVVFIPALAGIRPLEEDRESHDWRVEERQRIGRPLRMLTCAEPVDAIAEVPDGPPRQFRWRRVIYHVASSEGPERIAPEWWRERKPVHVRDYYRVEDEEGRRFWLYRDGLFGRETNNPQWYVHGVFG